jgi:uncharacterized protein
VATHVELAVSAHPKPHPKASKTKDRRAGNPPAKSAQPPAKNARGKKAASDDEHPEPGIELEKDELGAIVVEGEHLDTEPLIVEQVLLEVPMKPLCSADCRGLCPRCGADRNLDPDCCQEPAADERWEALGALRDRLSADGR